MTTSVGRWRNSLISIREGVGVAVGMWFDDNISREVEDGTSTLF